MPKASHRPFKASNRTKKSQEGGGKKKPNPKTQQRNYCCLLLVGQRGAGGGGKGSKRDPQTGGNWSFRDRALFRAPKLSGSLREDEGEPAAGQRCSAAAPAPCSPGGASGSPSATEARGRGQGATGFVGAARLWGTTGERGRGGCGQAGSSGHLSEYERLGSTRTGHQHHRTS